MKHKLYTLLMMLVAMTPLWASNIITYMAKEKLPETTSNYDPGLKINAFNVPITSHSFSNGKGTITFSGEVTTIGYKAFEESTGLTSVTIPNSVTTIGNYAFSACYDLASITIPNSVTTIGGCAFIACHSLKSIIIPNSVKTIGNSAFCYCSGLKSVTISNSVTTIGNCAFEKCTYLKVVTLGKAITQIGCDAFKEDYRIEEFISEAEVTPNVCATTFDGLSKKYIYLYVPENSKHAYQVDPNWNEFDIHTRK